MTGGSHAFRFGLIVAGDARKVLLGVPADSMDLSFWSPPYHVGKSYERGQSLVDWQDLLRGVIGQHTRIMKPGCFMAVNIGDILCFPDAAMPRFQADNMRGKRSGVARADVLAACRNSPGAGRREMARLLGCSEQTVQRRLENNNAGGGKAATQTNLLTGSMLVSMAEECGFHLYDRRIWRKDPCWATCRWHSASYRAVGEFEHVFVFWKPGITQYDRSRLSGAEWPAWGSRGVWDIASVRSNRRHGAEFPEGLAARVIRLFSPAGGTVLDPFVGTGTTTAVAKRLGRRWLGIDSSPGTAAMARRRMAESVPP